MACQVFRQLPLAPLTMPRSGDADLLRFAVHSVYSAHAKGGDEAPTRETMFEAVTRPGARECFVLYCRCVAVAVAVGVAAAVALAPPMRSLRLRLCLWRQGAPSPSCDVPCVVHACIRQQFAVYSVVGLG
jgi:hypothetical protein